MDHWMILKMDSYGSACMDFVANRDTILEQVRMGEGSNAPRYGGVVEPLLNYVVVVVVVRMHPM